MKLGALIEKLKEKDLTQDVEFIICNKEGLIVAMNIEGKAKDMASVLSLFMAKSNRHWCAL